MSAKNIMQQSYRHAGKHGDGAFSGKKHGVSRH